MIEHDKHMRVRCNMCHRPITVLKGIGGRLCDDCYDSIVGIGKAVGKRDPVDRPVEPYSDEWKDQRRGM